MNTAQRIGPLLFVLAVSCSKTSAPDAPAANASGTIDAQSVVLASATATGSAAAATPKGAEQASFTGKFDSVATPTSEAAGGKAAREAVDPGTGLGSGPVTLVVDDKTGRVSGEFEGPLAGCRIQGVVANDDIAADIIPREPGKTSLYGALTGKRVAGTIDGAAQLASPYADAVRTAKFTLQKK